MVLAPFVFAAVTGTVLPPAAPLDPGRRWASHVLAVDVHLGLAAPLGLYGVALDATVSPSVSLVAGVGRGLSGRQLAAGVRLRGVADGGVAGGVGLALSRGDFDTGLGLPHGSRFRFEDAVWVDGEAFVELRRGIRRLRLYAGLAVRAADAGCAYEDVGAPRVTPCDQLVHAPTTSRMPVLPYVGLAVGLGLPAAGTD